MSGKKSGRGLPLPELIAAVLFLIADLAALYFILTSGFISGPFRIVLILSCVFIAVADIAILLVKY